MEEEYGKEELMIYSSKDSSEGAEALGSNNLILI